MKRKTNNKRFYAFYNICFIGVRDAQNARIPKEIQIFNLINFRFGELFG